VSRESHRAGREIAFGIAAWISVITLGCAGYSESFMVRKCPAGSAEEAAGVRFRDDELARARTLVREVAAELGCHGFSPPGPYYTQEQQDPEQRYLTRDWFECRAGLTGVFLRLLEAKDGSEIRFYVNAVRQYDQTDLTRSLEQELHDRLERGWIGYDVEFVQDEEAGSAIQKCDSSSPVSDWPDPHRQ
jgi:hypothetical protein